MRPAVAAVEPPLPPRGPVSPLRRRAGLAALFGGVAAIAMLSMSGVDVTEPVSAMIGDESEERAAPEYQLDPPGIAATEASPAAAPLPPIPERDGERLDEWYPTLRDWVHPVPGSTEIVPAKGSRLFGAARDHAANGCGGGHCGIDLEGERGQPVVAVAWGTVVKIERNDASRGGRYVRIEHPDFVYTSYFHLDAIAPELEVGMEVDPGQPIGTLGRSGIRVSMPHLHLALEVPEGATLRFIDPLPFLARSTVIEH